MIAITVIMIAIIMFVVFLKMRKLRKESKFLLYETLSCVCPTITLSGYE